MKKLFLTALLTGIAYPLFSQEYDMSYITFARFIQDEMTEDEYKSVDSYFEGNIDGLICYYDYGDFSGDTLDEFVVLTSENTFEHGQKINIYIFRGTEKGTFEFVDKLSFPYWRSRYEVAILIKRGLLSITSTDRDYENWTWSVYRIKEEGLKLVKQDVYQ